MDPITHVPVAAGPAYSERIQQLQSKFTATLKAEPGNRFHLDAVPSSRAGRRSATSRANFRGTTSDR
jgi:hypothetical protein